MGPFSGYRYCGVFHASKYCENNILWKYFSRSTRRSNATYFVLIKEKVIDRRAKLSCKF